jgi:predicted dinucleotide-binding enzyme
MVEPSTIPGPHDIFVCGNDAGAKAKVVDLLRTGFGWKEVVDLGDITGARSQEMILPLWLRLFMKFQSPNVNIHVAN